MHEDKKRTIVKTVIIIIFIGLPILVMFYDIALGGFFLLSGMYSTQRALRWIGNQHLQFDKTHQFHNSNAAGKNIFVQVVDDFGRELPPREVERLLSEARAKADPRDNVVPVNFKVNSSQDKTKTDSQQRDQR